MTGRDGIDVAAFMKALKDITERAPLLAVAAAETEFHQHARRFEGYSAVSDAFRSFVLSTMDMLNGPWRAHAASVPPLHTWLLLRLTDNFHWLCGAEHQAAIGYPFPAFAQVRNIFDSVVVSAAVVQGIVSIEEAEGLDLNGTKNDQGRVTARRKIAEKKIISEMLGVNSGLSPSAMEQLEKLNRVFNLETHGHRLSTTRSMPWLRGQAPLPVLPRFVEDEFAPFMNRHLETMWMVHRLMPLARPHAAPLHQRLAECWEVLDTAMRQCAFALQVQFGKPVGQAIVDFVTMKFPFSPSNTLPAPSRP
jgi:hypothetical protein